MNSNKDLILHLKKTGVLESSMVFRALERQDRINFIPEEFKNIAYNDTPIPIGRGQTNSQPYTVTFMLEQLEAEPGQKILDIGFGSGWTTALLSEIVGNGGEVFGMEVNKEIFEFGKKNLEKSQSRRRPFREKGTFSDIGNITLYNKSGFEGLPEHAPFDRILVSATSKVVPKKLEQQVKIGGRLVIPVNDSIVMVEKISQDKFQKEQYRGFAFVPLIK